MNRSTAALATTNAARATLPIGARPLVPLPNQIEDACRLIRWFDRHLKGGDNGTCE